MSAERKDVVFRRVRGRIVPIKVQRSESAKNGATNAATATAIGIGGAEATRLIDKAASRNAFKMNRFVYQFEKARANFGKKRKTPDARQLSFDVPNINSVKKAAGWRAYQARFVTSQVMKKSRPALLYGAAAGAGILAGRGLRDGAKALGISEDNQRDLQSLGRVGGTAGTLAYYMARTKRSPFSKAFLGLVKSRVR